ncbi:MAG TPA: proteasome activator [Actinomycetota bacterium]|nr:proteasome activator [Actinomycetota bacterium]
MDGRPDAEAPAPPEDRAEEGREVVTEPAKLLRIATMVRELLEETRQTSLDEAGRARLRQIYDRSVSELRDAISEELQEELAALAPPMEGIPSESELRVAQAQLVGWLEGLFHGIQAALWAQQMAARAQLEELRRRGLPAPGQPPGQPPRPDQRPPGQYL